MLFPLSDDLALSVKEWSFSLLLPSAIGLWVSLELGATL
jgi:hypothetical protein